jgi:DNA-binding transcriptional regulator LsrR (DeoR family)
MTGPASHRRTPHQARTEAHQAGISKAEIARRLQIGRTSVRRILE